MAGIIQSPANLPITLVKGADFALGLSITESAVPYPWAGATVTTSIVNSRTGEVNATNWTFTPGADGAATMTLTDTNTTALGVGTFDYYVQVTKSGTTTPWLAGQLSIRAPWETAVSAMTVNLSFSTGGSVTLTVTNSAPTASAVPITDAGGYFTATQVEAALQELGPRDYFHNQRYSGAESMPRMLAASAAIGTSNQVLRFNYFTATVTFTAANAVVSSGSTAAGATPTVVRVGLFSVAANGDLTLSASTANDTTLLAAANTIYTKALQATFPVVAGQRYAAGLLVVTGATAPTVLGVAPGGSASALSALSPRLTGHLTGQADLPSSATSASILTSNSQQWVAFTT